MIIDKCFPLVLFLVLLLVFCLFYFFICFILLVSRSNKSKYINAKTDRPFSKEDFTLSSKDIDLITPLLNKHMQSLDRENECGYSLSTEYWELMLKLNRIKSVLEEQNDINKNGKAGKKE